MCEIYRFEKDSYSRFFFLVFLLFIRKKCSFDGFYVVLWCLETCVRMRCPSALLRHGSLVGECFFFVCGFQVVSMVSTFEASCYSGWSQVLCYVLYKWVVKCNFVYVLLIVVDTSV
jgi:hypothetical protein